MTRKSILTTAVIAVTCGIVSGPAGAEALAPNGRIVFAQRSGDASPNIMTVNPDGTHAALVPLEQPAETWAIPVWSPDSSKLLISNLDRGESVDPEFVPGVVDPDGSNFTVLEATDAPADVTYCATWTLDGTRLLCSQDPESGAAGGVVSIRSTDGGGYQRITTNPYGSTDLPTDVSPDGTRFVFLRYRPGPQRGQRPFVAQQVALFVANPDGTHQQRITPYGVAQAHELASAQWSPDGTKIVSSTGVGFLLVVQPDGAGFHLIDLQIGTAQYFAFEPHWSPDGQQIVFCMFLNGQEDVFTSSIDGSNVRQITDTGTFENGPDWGTYPTT